MTDNSDAKSVDSWGAGTYATMQSTLVPMAHGERVFTCPKHGGQYDDRNALCRDCEQEFYEKRSSLKEQQALVQQRLQELGTAPDASNNNVNMDESQPPVSVVHSEQRSSEQMQHQQVTGTGGSGPPVETLQWSNPPPAQQHHHQQQQQDKLLGAPPNAPQTHSQVPTQVQTRPMYDLQQQQQQQQQQQPMYSTPTNTGNVNSTSMQNIHQQPTLPQMMQQQNPFHTQQQPQSQQQSHHPSTSQPSPTSHSLPPRYPGMGLPTQSPMQNHLQQQQQQQQQHQQQQQQQLHQQQLHQQQLNQQQQQGGNPHHHTNNILQPHPLPTTPLTMSQPPPPGPPPGGTPLAAAPAPFWSSPQQQQQQQPNSSPAQYDALTMQIQRMQQMQDWMIWQKENENAQLKQQLEQAQTEVNQLRLDNVLLTEKLHQQEQRMQQELKLIKMAAMQSRQQRKGANSQEKQLVLVQSQQHTPLPPPPAVNMMPSPTQTSSWQGFEDPAFFQPDFMPSSSLQSSEDNAQQQSRGKEQVNTGNHSNANNNDAINVSSHSLQQPQLGDLHDDSVGNSMGETLSDEGKDEFDSNSITWPASNGDANSVSGKSRANKTQQQKNAYKRKVGPLTTRAADLAISSPRRNNVVDNGNQAVGSSVNSALGANSQLLDKAPALESLAARPNHEEAGENDGSTNFSEPTWNKEPRQVDGSHQIRDLDEYSLEAASIPHDIGFDGGAPPPVPLEENITFGTNVPSHIQHHNNNSQQPKFGRLENVAAASSNIQAQGTAYPTTPPRPNIVTSELATNNGTSNGLPRNLPPRSPGTNPMGRSVSPPKPNAPKPRSAGVSFVDDNASVGHTVASSTFGEDRIKAQKQTIMDPYGDKGEYSGIILRSTGMPHGYGEMVYHEDKRTYAGEWRHGRWHGFGKASFANGDTYEGEYRFDQRHGRGIYQWHDGRVFDGMFREDKRHGKGKFIWPDGAVYEGEFRNGQREGQGQYTFSDGGKYEGSWKDGRYSGYGVCSWEDGRCYKGEWLNGMAHGKGVETFADGTVRHDGQWREDEPIVG